MGDMSTLIDLTPARVDVVVTQGDSLTFELVVNDSDGQPVGLAGEARAQARRTFKHSVSVTFGVATAGNVVSLTLTGVQTASMLGSWVWDIDYEADGKTTTIAAGGLRVTPEVSRG